MKNTTQSTIMWTLVSRDAITSMLEELDLPEVYDDWQDEAERSLWECLHSVYEVLTLSDDSAFVLVTQTLPACARLINVSLATGDIGSDDEATWDLIPQSLPGLKRLGKFCQLCIVDWSRLYLGRNPFASTSLGGSNTIASSPKLWIPVEKQAHFISVVRQIFSLYGRLTVKAKSWNEEEFLGEFHARIAEVVDLERVLTPRERFVMSHIGRVLLRDFYPERLLEPGYGVFEHGPGACSESDIKGHLLKDGVFDPRVVETDAVASKWLPTDVARLPFMRPTLEYWVGADGKPVTVSRFESFTVSEWLASGGVLNPIKLATYSKVSLVPKDYRGPRVIAAEPCLHQYTQSGYANEIISEVLHGWPLCGAVNLHRPELNANAARRGSQSVRCLPDTLVTIDLKDASDTVRMSHLRLMAAERPDVIQWLQEIRTPNVVSTLRPIPEKEMTTAFPMGSKLCFPTETLVYVWIALSAIWMQEHADSLEPAFGSYRQYCQEYDRRANLSVRPGELALLIKKTGLRAYGDDIVVAASHLRAVCSLLQRCGMKLNASKTCYGTPFKESCGGDYWGGYEVTPLRPRGLPGGTACSGAGLNQLAANFACKGLFAAALFALVCSQERQRLRVPLVESGSCPPSCIGSPGLFNWSKSHSSLFVVGKSSWNSDLQTTYFFAPLEKGRKVSKTNCRVLREKAMRWGRDKVDPSMMNTFSYLLGKGLALPEPQWPEWTPRLKQSIQKVVGFIPTYLQTSKFRAWLLAQASQDRANPENVRRLASRLAWCDSVPCAAKRKRNAGRPTRAAAVMDLRVPSCKGAGRPKTRTTHGPKAQR